MCDKPRGIQKPIAVAVEGQDYFHFLRSQFADRHEFEEVQLWDFTRAGTVDNWLRNFRTLRNFETVRAIGLIRDAEENSKAMLQAQQSAFGNNGLAIPKQNIVGGTCPATGVLLIPHERASGCLENAVLECARNAAHVNCAQDFLKCADDPSRNANWRAKVLVHAVISASSNPAMTLGQSALAGLWDLDAEPLKVMTDFIRMLVSTQT